MPEPVPTDRPALSPYLVVRDADRLIRFAVEALGAEELDRTVVDGRVRHAEIRVGGVVLMVGERPGGEIAAMLHLYIPDVDAAYRRALAAGATSIKEPTTHFYGDRGCGIVDPGGNTWWIATHVEDVPPDELARRAAAQA